MPEFELKPIRSQSKSKKISCRIDEGSDWSTKDLDRSGTVQEYWKSYQGFWDNFVKKWVEAIGAKRLPNDRLTRILFAAGRLDITKMTLDESSPKSDFDLDPCELVEPYQFYHGSEKDFCDTLKSIKAIVIERNPGRSHNNEDRKYYLNPLPESSDLIRSLLDEAGQSYWNYQANWSCNNPGLVQYVNQGRKDVPGVSWWNGKVPRLRAIFSDQTLEINNIISFELCPYHSKKWNLKVTEEFCEHIVDKVIRPAVMLAIQNNIPYVLCVKNTLAKVLSRKRFATQIVHWKPGDHQGVDWPQKDDGTDESTEFEVYKVDVDKLGIFPLGGGRKNVCFVFLTSGNGRGMNFPSVEKYRDAYQKILKCTTEKK